MQHFVTKLKLIMMRIQSLFLSLTQLFSFIYLPFPTLFFQISAVELEETETLVWNGKIRIQTKFIMIKNLLIQTENEK